MAILLSERKVVASNTFSYSVCRAVSLRMSCILFMSAGLLHAEGPDILTDCTRMGISGRVVDSISKKAIQGAKVEVRYFKGKKEIITTDQNGKFSVESRFEKAASEPAENRAKKFLSDLQPVSFEVEYENYQRLFSELTSPIIEEKCRKLLSENKYTVDYEPDLELVPVDQAKLSGPAHGRNLVTYDEKKLLELLKPTRPTFKAVLNKNDIEVWIQFAKFDAKKRQGEWRAIDNGYTIGKYYFLQGKYIRGLDNDDPTNPKYLNAISGERQDIRPIQHECSLLMIESITVNWNWKKEVVPQGFYDHIVLSIESSNFNKWQEEPLKGLFFTFDPNEKSLLICMSLGINEPDVGWTFKENEKCTYTENVRE